MGPDVLHISISKKTVAFQLSERPNAVHVESFVPPIDKVREEVYKMKLLHDGGELSSSLLHCRRQAKLRALDERLP